MGGKSCPAFQFYPADFLTDTAEWDAVEVGVYIRLLSQQWENESLPVDVRTLARICYSDLEEFVPIWENRIRDKFRARPDGRLENPRLAEEREKQRAYSESQSKRARKRWDQTREGDGTSRRDATVDTTAQPSADASAPARHIPERCSTPSSPSSSSSSKEQEGKKEGNARKRDPVGAIHELPLHGPGGARARNGSSRFLNDIREAPERWRKFPRLPDEANPGKYERIDCPIPDLWDEDWDEHAQWFREIENPTQLALIWSAPTRAVDALQVTYGPKTGERMWQELSTQGLVVWCGICPRAGKAKEVGCDVGFEN